MEEGFDLRFVTVSEDTPAATAACWVVYMQSIYLLCVRNSRM
jgi:hypothetical protein